MEEIKKKETNIMNFETIKKIIFQFYSRNDINFINLIFQEKDTSTFFLELEKFYKTIPNFSDTDIENKFYGIQNFTKLPKSTKELNKIELNKLNTDLIFVIVKQIMLSSYDIDKDNNKNNTNILDKKNLIRSRLIEVFNCPNISSIGFISNKIENYTSTYPVNFYAFCLSIKILLICFPRQIKNFHIGIFNSEQTSFNINTNNYFLSELFCSYVSFLYLSSKKLINELSTLSLHFFNDSNIYESFTFHINNNGFYYLKKILKNSEKFDILNLLNDYFNEAIKRISIFFHYNSIDANCYNNIIKFCNFPGMSKKIDIFCDKKIINNKNINFLKDLENCRELNIHIINTSSLVDSNIEDRINLKNEKILLQKHFSLEGDNIYLDNFPVDLSNIKTLKLINNRIPYYVKDEEDYKVLHKNIISFNFQKDIFINLNYLEELTLIYITPEQFFSLVSNLNNSSMKNNYQSNIIKLYLEINYSHLKIPCDNKSNIISKEDILGNVDSLIRNCERISNIRQLDLILVNDNPKNNLLLIKENGFYFINLALELLKKCYHFSLKNFNNYYYPLNDKKPEVKSSNNIQRRNFRKKVSEIIVNEEFCLHDNINNCLVKDNSNRELQVIYSGNDVDDYAKMVDLDSALPFLYVVENKLLILKAKTILINIMRFFNIKIEAPKQFSVCNFNN